MCRGPKWWIEWSARLKECTTGPEVYTTRSTLCQTLQRNQCQRFKSSGSKFLMIYHFNYFCQSCWYSIILWQFGINTILIVKQFIISSRLISFKGFILKFLNIANIIMFHDHITYNVSYTLSTLSLQYVGWYSCRARNTEICICPENGGPISWWGCTCGMEIHMHSYVLYIWLET